MIRKKNEMIATIKIKKKERKKSQPKSLMSVFAMVTSIKKRREKIL